MRYIKNKYQKALSLGLALFLGVTMLALFSSPRALAATPPNCAKPSVLVPQTGSADAYCQCTTADGYQYDCTPASQQNGGSHCGSGDNAVKTSINIGCKGQGNPITDMIFAFIRLLSDGVGLVVVASIIIAGIQYTTSAGDPQASAAATKRIQSTVVALIIYIFAYAILNYVIPAGFFKL